MKTLVIHPEDSSTDFLKEIYKDTDWTIINDSSISNKKKRKLIKDHDKIIMFGHGDEHGLHGTDRYVIDKKFVYWLKQKECICIWCNADVFFKQYSLKGICSGMIISEYDEALLMCLHDFTQKQIDESNTLFAQAVKESINSSNPLEFFSKKYKSENNPIILYNKNNYYVSRQSY